MKLKIFVALIFSLLSNKILALDYLKPIYTKENAIVCPYGLTQDIRLDHKNLLTLFNNTEDARQKAFHIGCRKFPADARMYTYDIGKGLIAISPTETNYYQFITTVNYLKNDNYLDGYYESLLRRKQAIELEEMAAAIEENKRIEKLKNEEIEKEIAAKQKRLEAELNFINCNDDGVCSDAPNAIAKRMIERQWQECPPSVREKCLKKKKFEQAQDCLMTEGVEYMKNHPQEFAKWLFMHPEDGYIATPPQ